jgi:hypothetical protein
MLSTFGFSGSPSAAKDSAYDGGPLGTSWAGTWGIGARIRDMSFIEDLKHTFRVNFFGGTNSPTMAKYITGKKYINGTRANTPNRGGAVTDFYGAANSTNAAGAYLTTLDYGLEINFDSSYKIYENLEMILELGYIHLWLDQSRGVWGADGNRGIRGVKLTDAVKAGLTIRYTF